MISPLTAIRAEMRARHLMEDANVLSNLVGSTDWTPEIRQRIQDRALQLVEDVRAKGTLGMTEAFLNEYGLSTEEGVAIMTLAEALLRVPDAATKDALIEDKTADRNWMKHAGKSDSAAVNASTLALSLTGSVLTEADGAGVGPILRRATKRVGAPIIRAAVGQVMQQLGQQFVLGETIQDALSRAEKQQAKGYTYSYDMLGEAAMTAEDAETFCRSYADAIDEIGSAGQGGSVQQNPGISVKLSALHPRYEFLQRDRVMAELAPRLLSLCKQAAQYNIGLNVDAEEADRLDLSLDVIQSVLADPALAGWDGFGVVVQAYGKRASWVLDWLYALAGDLDRRIMVRLVKGAYWDTEIKKAQVEGLRGFPVFVQKTSTDISYLCCAKKLLGMRDRIYPQFATHNAHSVAGVLELAGNAQGFEFQRLHGMGEALHAVTNDSAKVPCRIYAPVGAHKELLAYLVRRLLENGANSSFVNQIVDKDIPSEALVCDPFDAWEAGKVANAAVVAPKDLYGAERPNSAGVNLQDIEDVTRLDTATSAYDSTVWAAGPLLAVPWDPAGTEAVCSPYAPETVVGHVAYPSHDSVAAAVKAAQSWALPVAERVAVLMRAADLYEAHLPAFASLLAREAGKTRLDIVGEVREAVDFLRYYAAQASHWDSHVAKGVITAISPWNFPLAIFTGQIAAALATGNAVLAKPAEATPLIAHEAVTLLHKAGVPRTALQLIPGAGGTVGAQLTAAPELAGVCFTGSTQTAQRIHRTMADAVRPTASLLAETGGLNAMIVDSTALPEQAVRDIVASAFQSAGQRCSALRVLYVQNDIADGLIRMLTGAMDALVVGDPTDRATDVGPVIDARAKARIEAHIAAHRPRVLKQLDAPKAGYFVPPTLIELDGIHQLDQEIFGPVLHVCRFEAGELDDVIGAINATGYGLTFGLHSRLTGRAEEIAARVAAGNVYINRNQIGAVVGSQPFGGEGLSGTGPKAGGPHYLSQFVKLDDGVASGDAIATLPVQDVQLLIDQAAWAQSERCLSLPGPTGETNLLAVSGRGVVLCMGPGQGAAQAQKAAVEATGGYGVIAAVAPEDLGVLRGFAGVAVWGDVVLQRACKQALAARDGAILPILPDRHAIASFVKERHVCIDTTAAGGNASLLAATG